MALDRYNRCILYEKAQSLEKESAQLSQTKEQIASNTKKKKECEERAVSLQDELVQMDAMRESMEKERESLNKSDAVALKDRELSLSKELTEHQALFNKKKSSLAAKEDQYIDLQNRKKLEEDQSYEKETQIKDLLEEMQSDADEMAFEEHTFMQDELLSDLENDYSFDLHKQQFETVKTKIRKGVQLLRNMQGLEREKDELLKKREQNASESDKAERKQNELGCNVGSA